MGKNRKSHEAFEVKPKSTIELIHSGLHGRQKLFTDSEQKGVTPKSDGIDLKAYPQSYMRPCDCGCGRHFQKRGDKRFYSRQHKDRYRNRQRLEAVKDLNELRKLLKNVQTILDGIYGPL